jgi:hypothetical protein
MRKTEMHEDKVWMTSWRSQQGDEAAVSYEMMPSSVTVARRVLSIRVLVMMDEIS